MRSRSWQRRTVLGLGLAAAAGWSWPVRAAATEIAVGQLAFTIPSGIDAVAGDPTLGQGWQWQGRDTGPGPRPSTVVLARADLASTDAEEIMGLVLAGSLAGRLTALQLGGSRERATPGGGTQRRYSVAYTPARGLGYRGTLLVATRPEPPAGLLVMLGNDTLTAGVLEAVLDSVRWRA